MFRTLQNKNFYAVFVIDACLVLLSLYLAYAVHFEFQIPAREINGMLNILPYVLLIKLAHSSCSTFTRVCGATPTHAWHLYILQLELEALTITRDQFIEQMAERGIGTSVHFTPLHLHP